METATPQTLHCQIMHTNGVPGGLANKWEWMRALAKEDTLALASSGALKPDETLETSSSGPRAARLWLAGRAVLDAARRPQAQQQ